jgi:hypothetical protein
MKIADEEFETNFQVMYKVFSEQNKNNQEEKKVEK